MRPAVSVVICTHNRSGLLEAALRSVAAQSLTEHEVEILVVDNASNDDTAEVVERVRREFPSRTIVRVREDRLGLNHARNAGVLRSTGQYVAFLDDDEIAPATWLADVLHRFGDLVPKPVVVTGPLLCTWDSPPPPWFRDGWLHKERGESARYCAADEVIGGNMIFDGPTLRSSLFDTAYGHRGRRLDFGDETELMIRIEKDHEQAFYYDPALAVLHRVEDRRRTVGYLLSNRYARGRAMERLTRGPAGGSAWRAMLDGIVRMARHTAGAAFAIRDYEDARTWLVERGGQVAGQLGRLSESVAQARSRWSWPSRA